MTLLAYGEEFLEHRTTPGHPERAERLRAIWNRLTSTHLADQCQRMDFGPIELGELERVHDPRVIAAAERTARRGGHLDPDTPVSARSPEIARRAAGAAVVAVDRVLSGEDKNALCLVRPPGHHACPGHSMGFCLFNNIALAARRAIDRHGLERLLIVDFDVHHGNGTQDCFFEEPHVYFFSIHRYPFYPGSGDSSETGRGRGAGTIFNQPVPYDAASSAYHSMFRRMLEDAATRAKPQLVLLSAGFDADHRDPIGGLGLEAEDFVRLTRDVLDVADSFAGGKVVSLLEGGYDLEALAEGVEGHLRELLARSNRTADAKRAP